MCASGRTRAEDPDIVAANETAEFDPWNNFEIGASSRFHRRFAENGGISEESGMLAVETVEGKLIGSASWFTAQHAPSAAGRALNVLGPGRSAFSATISSAPG
jgi:hypothetical protein